MDWRVTIEAVYREGAFADLRGWGQAGSGRVVSREGASWCAVARYGVSGDSEELASLDAVARFVVGIERAGLPDPVTLISSATPAMTRRPVRRRSAVRG